MSATSHQHGSTYSNVQELHGLVVPGKGGGILGDKTGIVHLLAGGIKVTIIKQDLISFLILFYSGSFNFIPIFKYKLHNLIHK